MKETHKEIHGEFINIFMDEAKWLGIEGSWFTEGFKAGKRYASQNNHIADAGNMVERDHIANAGKPIEERCEHGVRWENTCASCDAAPPKSEQAPFGRLHRTHGEEETTNRFVLHRTVVNGEDPSLVLISKALMIVCFRPCAPNIDRLSQSILALYKRPPTREWVDLTDEEIDEAWQESYEPDSDDMSVYFFCRRIAAKLKEKNA